MNLAKTILRNTLSNWTGMVLTTIITVLLTPYILKHLGQERYGTYSIVFAVMQYLVLLEFGIRGAVARFAAKYIQGQDPDSLSSVISAAMTYSMCLGWISVGLSILLGFWALDFFGIPAEYRRQTLLLFVASGFNLMLSLLSYSLSGVLIGSNRYDLQNVQVILVTLLRAVLVVLFFSIGWISLSSWALAIVVASACGLLYLLVAAKYLQPKLRISPRQLRLDIFKEMFSFSAWNVVLQASGLITTSANPIIIGRILGSAVVPFYSIPFMLVTRLQAGVVGLTSTLMPHASAALNTGDKTMLAHLLKKGTYTAALLIFPLGGCLLVMCKDLFRVWLPSEYEQYWVIFAIFMAAYFGSITQSTSYYILLGGGEIKGMAKMYFAAAVGMIIISIIFMKVFALGVYGAALALAICRFCSTCLFQPWYASRQAGLGYLGYLGSSYIRPILCSLPSMVLAYLLLYFLPPKNLFVWAIEYVVSLLPIAFLVLSGICPLPVSIDIRQKVMSVFNLLRSKNHSR